MIIVCRVKVVLTRARLAMRCYDANKKEKICKEKSAVQCVPGVSVCSSEDAQATCWPEYGACERESASDMCAVCAAELVRVRSIGEYLSAAVGYEMRYGPRDTRHDRARTRAPLRAPAYFAAQPVRHVKSEPTEHQTDHPDTIRLTYPCKRLRLSSLAITVYNTYHMEWDFIE